MEAEMSIYDWKSLAKARLMSDLMTDEEWDAVLDALLHESEGSGIEHFDDVINHQWANQHKSNN